MIKQHFPPIQRLHIPEFFIPFIGMKQLHTAAMEKLHEASFKTEISDSVFRDDIEPTDRYFEDLFNDVTEIFM